MLRQQDNSSSADVIPLFSEGRDRKRSRDSIVDELRDEFEAQKVTGEQIQWLEQCLRRSPIGEVMRLHAIVMTPELEARAGTLGLIRYSQQKEAKTFVDGVIGFTADFLNFYLDIHFNRSTLERDLIIEAKSTGPGGGGKRRLVLTRDPRSHTCNIAIFTAPSETQPIDERDVAATAMFFACEPGFTEDTFSIRVFLSYHSGDQRVAILGKNMLLARLLSCDVWFDKAFEAIADTFVLLSGLCEQPPVKGQYLAPLGRAERCVSTRWMLRAPPQIAGNAPENDDVTKTWQMIIDLGLTIDRHHPVGDDWIRATSHCFVLGIAGLSGDTVSRCHGATDFDDTGTDFRSVALTYYLRAAFADSYPLWATVMTKADARGLSGMMESVYLTYCAYRSKWEHTLWRDRVNGVGDIPDVERPIAWVLVMHYEDSCETMRLTTSECSDDWLSSHIRFSVRKLEEPTWH